MPQARRPPAECRYLCKTCGDRFRSNGGLIRHTRARHPKIQAPAYPLGFDPPQQPPLSPSPPPVGPRKVYHPLVNGAAVGEIDRRLARPPPLARPEDPWFPFNSRARFELAEWVFTYNETSASELRELLAFFKAFAARDPYKDRAEILRSIDAIPYGNLPFRSETARIVSPTPHRDAPVWMSQDFTYYYRNARDVARAMLSNPSFNGHCDYAPYRQFDEDGGRVLSDFFSGDWTWAQCDHIGSSYPDSTFVPIILGADKTTASAATGGQEFHPVYMSLGNLHNDARRRRHNGVMLLGFLCIPKASEEEKASREYRRFRRQLTQFSLRRILEPLRQAMSRPEATLCADSRTRMVIYGIGSLCLDYPEQCWFACILQGWCPRCLAHRTNLDAGGARRTETLRRLHIIAHGPAEAQKLWGWSADAEPFTAHFPRADIYEITAADLLHQFIKLFRDHNVEWVTQIILSLPRGKSKLGDLDRRLAAMPRFPGLRRFPQGRRFKQWTGNDSRALMKIFLAAIAGLVPAIVVRAVRLLLDIIYIVRRAWHSEEMIRKLESLISEYHTARGKAFSGVRGGTPDGSSDDGENDDDTELFSLPRQHAIPHYPTLIRLFGSPNGLSTSIFESAHIDAVKKPWRRSNRDAPILQMLKTNQRLDQLRRARSELAAHGLFQGPLIPDDDVPMLEPHAGLDDPDWVDDPAEATPQQVADGVYLSGILPPSRTLQQVAQKFGLPDFPHKLACFLYHRMNPHLPPPRHNRSRSALPQYRGKVTVYSSARAFYTSTADVSAGPDGQCHELVRASSWWSRSKSERFDGVLLRTSSPHEASGLGVGRVYLFFTIMFEGSPLPLAVIERYKVLEHRDEPTGMWIAQRPRLSHYEVIEASDIIRGASLLPVFGKHTSSKKVNSTNVFKMYKYFFINRFIDQHAHDQL